ncbi:MAG: hypothetical protein ISP94_00310 [SAR86 cluster bacterium]|nr:hypothetical protein [SAR86 cluster bacterium]
MKVGITTIPFHEDNIKLLESYGFKVKLNPFNQKIQRHQIYDFLNDCDAVIAGTEIYDEDILHKLKNLKAISRVGVGTDNVNHSAAEKLNIKIFNTPSAPSKAVAEYCLGLIIYFLRDVHFSNLRLKRKVWSRELSLSLEDAKICIVGGGRIAKKLVKMLIACGAKNIIVIDTIDLSKDADWKHEAIRFGDKTQLSNADIISFHVPLTTNTKNYLNFEVFKGFKKKPYIINTSRGEIINEEDLKFALEKDLIRGGALDVFKEEPYNGNLTEYHQLITTPHIASTSKSSRMFMEKQSCKNLIEYAEKK